MNDHQQRRTANESPTIGYTMELDALADGWAGRIGTPAVQRIRHLTDGQLLYVPGSGFGGTASLFTLWRPAEVHSHPLNPKQLAVLPGWFGAQTAGKPLLVSAAHLAHRDCAECADVWTRAATHWEGLDPSEAMIFARYELNTRADLLIHVEDIPQSWSDDTDGLDSN